MPHYSGPSQSFMLHVIHNGKFEAKLKCLLTFLWAVFDVTSNFHGKSEGNSRMFCIYISVFGLSHLIVMDSPGGFR